MRGPHTQRPETDDNLHAADHPNVSKHFGTRLFGHSKEEMAASSSIDKISEAMRIDGEFGVEIARRSARTIAERLHTECKSKIAKKFIEGLLRASQNLVV